MFLQITKKVDYKFIQDSSVEIDGTIPRLILVQKDILDSPEELENLEMSLYENSNAEGSHIFPVYFEWSDDNRLIDKNNYVLCIHYLSYG